MVNGTAPIPAAVIARTILYWAIFPIGPMRYFSKKPNSPPCCSITKPPYIFTLFFLIAEVLTKLDLDLPKLILFYED